MYKFKRWLKDEIDAFDDYLLGPFCLIIPALVIIAILCFILGV